MKGALRWLLGPDLQFGPPDADDPYDPTSQTIPQNIWSGVLSHGEFIKFLHNAIEWENMLYFLYPYFWSHTRVWELKKYLDHQDPMHLAFLKAGAARVVLTIRPGYELAFTALLQSGSFFEALQAPGLDYPYMTIAQEMRSYAETNYPGTRPANPIEDARPLLTPMQKKAWADLQVLIKLAETYFQRNGHYPQTESWFSQMQGCADVLVPGNDPWGRAYAYTCPGTHGDYDLASLGPDGQLGAPDGGDDITSWAGPPSDPDDFKASQAWDDIQVLKRLLGEFHRSNGRYPTTAEGIEAVKALAPVLVPTRDPWGHSYDYTSPGRYGNYDLLSFGADQTLDQSDEKEHITNWAEASLIGTWFEYTPVSAMDCDFVMNA